MDQTDINAEENITIVSQKISKLIENIRNKILLNNKSAKECEELVKLKEECCSSSKAVSFTALHGIYKLVEENILVGSKTVSTLVALLPAVIHCNALISTIGSILLLDLKEQIAKNKTYNEFYGSEEILHPFVMILKTNGEKSWCEIYFFVNNVIQNCNDINWEFKIRLLKPIFQYVFSSSKWKGSQFVLKLFNSLILQINKREVINFALELLVWQDMDIQFCMFLQDIFINLLKSECSHNKMILVALTPLLAEAIKWIILNGYNPTSWIVLLSSSIQIDHTALSVVLYILADVVVETSSLYITTIIDVCKTIICSSSCNRYVAFKFVAVTLNWFINSSSLVYPAYKMLEDIFSFLQKNMNEMKDQTTKLMNNEYFKNFGSHNNNVKFAVDLITVTTSWHNNVEHIIKWLTNVNDYGEYRMQLRLHSFISGITLYEKDKTVNHLCLEIVFKVVNHFKDVSISHLCLLFYKLARETDPFMQKTCLLTLPKLAVRKENIPLILGVIESLKNGNPKLMAPVVIQLLILLWKMDNRTYSFLHKMLYDESYKNLGLEMNISKAIACREICRLAPHLHGKDVVSVLSLILNESAGSANGLPSAIAIEAIIELCKAYVIDVSGTWETLKPKLSVDKRPKVIIALCKFFAEIPSLNSSEKQHDQLIRAVIVMLWNYTFFSNDEVVRNAFKALSNFDIEDLDLELLPECYRATIELPKQSRKNPAMDPSKLEDASSLSYIPGECWLQFLEQINESFLKEGSTLIKGLVEKELNSLPRGLFYWPAGKSEPLNYSYLSQRSICRVLVERLLSAKNITNPPRYLKEIFSILSHNYEKAMPPLDWCFLTAYMNFDSEYLYYTISILAKQGSLSRSAKLMLENYLTTSEWNIEKLEEVVFIHSKIQQLCTAVSYEVLNNFCKKTITLCLRSTIRTGSNHFEKTLESLSQALKDNNISCERKIMIAKHLENILPMIPPEHKIMKSYGLCASELPVEIIDNISVVNSQNKIQSDFLHRAIIIIYSIGMRPDIQNPLVWFNQLIDATGNLPEKQHFLLYKILLIIRNRRSCNHTTWLEELMWRIQSSITNSEPTQVILFLINVFVSAVIVLAGYDCLFTDVQEISTSGLKNLNVFPQSFDALCKFPDWITFTSKISLCLQHLLKWKNLPGTYAKVFAESILILRNSNERDSAYFLNFILKMQ